MDVYRLGLRNSSHSVSGDPGALRWHKLAFRVLRETHLGLTGCSCLCSTNPPPPQPREGFQAREGAPSSGAGVKSAVRQVRECPGDSIFDLVQDLDVPVAVEDRWVVRELGIIPIPWSDHLKKN